MLNGKKWPHHLPQFLTEADILLGKMQECCQHLELIPDDRDAIECMLRSLSSIARRADELAVRPMADFALHIHRLLHCAAEDSHLSSDTLHALRDCLTLLAWQLELIDPHTGQLELDEDEQAQLIATLAARTDHHQGGPSEARRFRAHAPGRG